MALAPLNRRRVPADSAKKVSVTQFLSTLPEEAELAKKRVELSSLQAELVDRELELMNRRLLLEEFKRQYHLVVGPAQAELDAIEAEIAEYQARRCPHDVLVQARAARSRAQADQSARLLRRQPPTHVAAEARDRLRQLYREVARCVHPDLTLDGSSTASRTRLMAEANQAYAEADEEGLRAILAEWRSSPDGVLGDDVAAELVRTIRAIHQVSRKLEAVAKELDLLVSSKWQAMKDRAEALSRSGGDLLSQLAAGVAVHIAAARERLAALVGESV